MIAIKSFIQLVIPEYLILIFFLIFSYSLIVFQGIPNFVLLLFPFLAISFGMFGLNILNNIMDIEFDKINKPKRPLPSGKIKISEAKFLCILCFLIALVFGFLVSPFSFILIIFFIFLAYVYSCPPFRLNKYFWGSSIIGGLEYSAIPCALVWQSIGGNFSALFFVVFYFLVFFGPIIKDFEDVINEKKRGYKTIPILIGKKNSAILILLAYFLINGFVGMLAFFGFLKTSFLSVALANTVLLLILAMIFIKKLGKKEVVITQSKLMTYAMIVVSLMLLGYGAAALGA